MTADHNVPNITLTSGAATVQIPQLGYGVWQVEDDQATPAVAEALRAGYRSVDTARIYGNEAGVGRALAESDLPAQDVFLTTKVWNDDQGFEETVAAFEASQDRLGRPIDLYLIHWPAPANGKFVDTYRAMMQLRDEGKVRAIGVCNFNVEHLEELHDAVGEYPAINQVELHPNFQQKKLREFHDAHGIVTEAWSPLGQGGEILNDTVITDIASQYGKTPAQVILRWHLQSGNVVIPKSVTPARIAENFDVFDFELSDLAMQAIGSLDNGTRLGPDPAEFNG
ncbi:aldo/keto reductase [Yimella sp. cx-51]|uniref:aldo/keto reductase n=1 Tax=Yimella sp. cx-51 TaxID=2770551 RepID=UPI00165EB2E4|nr:aldo/keto reductase [Yimella sp. cx-51]MBC9958150.1 aldo/keto reductase [Yimella sp. cx-51]MBD2758992.1 aldo/keto reductase [Yimella sp. cx-573]QTH38813.1 aldo/keto reductase [Yimella sp. cx-51]